MSESKEKPADLLAQVKVATEPNNALDMAIEIALFKPDETYVAVRANSAGTKLIYTDRAGKPHTHWAWDWTLYRLTREQAIERLTALSQEPSP